MNRQQRRIVHKLTGQELKGIETEVRNESSINYIDRNEFVTTIREL